MKVREITASPLQYGDAVKTKVTHQYEGLQGKIIEMAPSSAKVRFEGIKKPVSIMLNALERI